MFTERCIDLPFAEICFRGCERGFPQIRVKKPVNMLANGCRGGNIIPERCSVDQWLDFGFISLLFDV